MTTQEKVTMVALFRHMATLASDAADEIQNAPADACICSVWAMLQDVDACNETLHTSPAFDVFYGPAEVVN